MAWLGATNRSITSPPGQVIGISAQVISSTEIDLSWPQVPGATSYNIRRDGALIANTASLSFPDTGLTASTTYSYRISALNKAGEGLQSFPPTTATTSSGGQTFVIQSLITGINNGMNAFDDHGGNSITWMTDVTGGFARVNTAPNPPGTVQGGTCGLTWTGLDTTKKGIYLKYDLRRFTAAANSKECKIFGNGYPVIYSDFTWGCNVGGYTGNTPGLSYSDSVSGGDINTQFWLYAAPTLTGGSSYSRTPHPTIKNQPSSAFRYDVAGNWQTHELWMQQNTDGTPDGEVAQWIDGNLVFWANAMWNCRTGGQGFVRVDLFGYTDPANPALIEDYRNFYASYDRPTGRGI